MMHDYITYYSYLGENNGSSAIVNSHRGSLLLCFWRGIFFLVRRKTSSRPPKKVEAPAATKEQAVQEKEKPYTAETEKIEPAQEPTAPVAASKTARTITVDTPLYQARISENSAVFYSFLLKNYRETVAQDSPLKQILSGDETLGVGQIGFTGKSISGTG